MATRSTLPPARLRFLNCGTEAGARNHYRQGEQPCPACRRATQQGSAERRALRVRRHGHERTTPIPDELHGTRAGAEAHYRLGEKPCEPCRLAKNDANRHYYRTGTYVTEQRAS